MWGILEERGVTRICWLDWRRCCVCSLALRLRPAQRVTGLVELNRSRHRVVTVAIVCDYQCHTRVTRVAAEEPKRAMSGHVSALPVLRCFGRGRVTSLLCPDGPTRNSATRHRRF
jgi:hypothetical protein